MIWTGWTLSGLVILFLTMDCVMKLLDLDVVKRSTSQIGFPLNLIRPIALIELICVIAYAMPRTAVLGAILLTGLFGEQSPVICGWATRFSRMSCSAYMWELSPGAVCGSATAIFVRSFRCEPGNGNL
jgi:hypothetical protein